jgi:hypothetical protein
MIEPASSADWPVLSDATIPELPNHYRGKVRDNYDLPDGRRILIATDRLSAFDRILAAIPFKGQVLTQTARFWFEATGDICPNHVVAYPDPNVVLGRRLDILPVEIVVRGYLAGETSRPSFDTALRFSLQWVVSRHSPMPARGHMFARSGYDRSPISPIGWIRLSPS